MAQFLLISTLLSIAGLIATSVYGYLASPQHVATHIFIALATVIAGLFSQSMTMFFFIGTGRQLKDKTHATNAEADVRAATRRLAMRVSPAATYAMLLLMITFITGGGVASGKTPHWLHLSLTIGSLLLYLRAYWIEIHSMEENARLIERYLAD